MGYFIVICTLVLLIPMFFILGLASRRRRSSDKHPIRTEPADEGAKVRTKPGEANPFNNKKRDSAV